MMISAVPSTGLVEVSDLDEISTNQLSKANLRSYRLKTEQWNVDARGSALRYSTHGALRYFGKFPPQIGSYLLSQYSDHNAYVVDPFCGSGTLAVDAILQERTIFCSDVSPLSILITKAKTSHIDYSLALEALEKVTQKVRRLNIADDFRDIPQNVIRWFLPSTLSSIIKIKIAIGLCCNDEKIKTLFLCSLAAIIRTVSLGTNQQGRLFKDIESAVPDALEHFLKKTKLNIRQASSLPPLANVFVSQATAGEIKFATKPDLAVLHPPYFNSYKYSTVYVLELGILGIDRSSIKNLEVRESFKMGAKARIDHYLEDMVRVLKNVTSQMKPNGKISLIIGDTILLGEYQPVLSKLLEAIAPQGFEVEKLAIRRPKHSEATWVASQRRSRDSLGNTISDYVAILSRK